MLQFVQIVQREHGREGNRVLGMVADDHGRRPELPSAGRAAGTVDHHDGTRFGVGVAAVRPEQPRVVGVMVAVMVATVPELVPHRKVLVMRRLVALVEAVALAARAAAVAAPAACRTLLPAHRARPRLAPFPFHLGPAHLEPADLELRPSVVDGRPRFFPVRVGRFVLIVATCNGTQKMNLNGTFFFNHVHKKYKN